MIVAILAIPFYYFISVRDVSPVAAEILRCFHVTRVSQDVVKVSIVLFNVPSLYKDNCPIKHLSRLDVAN